MVATLTAAAASLMLTLGLGPAPVAPDAHGCTAGQVVDVAGAAYVIVFDVLGGQLVHVEMYLESNGIPGPQRGPSILPGPDDDDCYTENPDTRIL